MLHGPSLAIGAAIASIVSIIAFIGFNSISNQTALVIEPTPTAQQVSPSEITADTFFANGSPIIGDPNAPIDQDVADSTTDTAGAGVGQLGATLISDAAIPGDLERIGTLSNDAHRYNRVKGAIDNQTISPAEKLALHAELKRR